MPVTLSRIAKRRKDKDLEAGIYGYITFKITDHGKVVLRRKRQMHSLTGLWFLILWYGVAYNQNTFKLTAYSPNTFNVGTFSNNNFSSVEDIAFWFVASSPYVGIVVGTGQNPKNPQDYTLASPVTSSSTGLTYGTLSVPSPTVSGNTSTLSMSRTFTNNGSSSITLTEAAIIVYCSGGSSTSPVFDAALAYDYISPSITLAQRQILTITYQIQVTT
jgi:hypothetical protein